MHFEQLFDLSSGGMPGALHVKRALDETWTDLKSDPQKIAALARGEMTPALPLRFIWSMGEIPMDQITTALVKVHIFSERVFECFRHNRFTGWSTFPVEITGRHGTSIPNYRGLAVTGRCGQIDSTRSVRTARPPRKQEGDADIMMGLYFDPDSWDGSHIFTPGAKIFVVEDVKTALEEIKATNIRFRPLTEMENHQATLRLRDSAEKR
jgi:hypothetical protein